MWTNFKKSVIESPFTSIILPIAVAYLYKRIRSSIFRAINAISEREIRIVRKYIIVDIDTTSGEYRCGHQILFRECNICLDTVAKADIIYFECEQCGDLPTDDSCPHRPAPGEW